MKGLILKDFYMVNKYCRTYLFIMVAFLFASFFGSQNTFFVIYPLILTSTIPVAIMGYEERSHWDLYCKVFPYSDKQIVSTKYIMSIIIGLTIWIISSSVQAIRMIISNEFIAGDFFKLSVELLIVGLIAPCLILPFIFKLGCEKGRIAYYIAIGLLCAVSTVFAVTAPKLPNSITLGLPLLLSIALIVTVLLFFGSWRLSICFYKRRNF